MSAAPSQSIEIHSSLSTTPNSHPLSGQPLITTTTCSHSSAHAPHGSSVEDPVPNNSLAMGVGHPLLGPDGLVLGDSPATSSLQHAFLSASCCNTAGGGGGAGRRMSHDSVAALAPGAGECCEGPVPNNSIVDAVMSVVAGNLSRHGTRDSFSSFEQLVPNNSVVCDLRKTYPAGMDMLGGSCPNPPPKSSKDSEAAEGSANNEEAAAVGKSSGEMCAFDTQN